MTMVVRLNSFLTFHSCVDFLMAKSSAVAMIDVELQNPVISAEDVRINMADRSDGEYCK